MNLKEETGELIGTFILVFIGCSSVAGAVVLGAFNSLLEVAFIWGLGVAIAIYIARNLGPAHLNPAVSLAMLMDKQITFKKLLSYSLFQFIGALLAGLFVYMIFNPSIEIYEQTNNILRGTKGSHLSAVMFGEFFPNPGFAKSIGEIGWVKAMLLEAFGSMLMILAIFGITKNSKENDSFVPWAIGFTVAMLICFVAPFTQAGFNPARDFGPRLIAFFTGWGEHAFPTPSFSFFTVYILGPCLGGVVAVKLKNLIKL